jgi:hypothetical protein
MPDHEYLVLSKETLAGLRRAVEAGELYFPEWFPKIRTAGFHVVPVTDVVHEEAAA